ncbi:outer membrane protein assembly factor BamE [Endozoicomonas sp. SM1973]|uniref:Outer membrane protein assembly factor BamE n=1 Tax=Spartinivicinus marinus TaxID=2994442 RepID=A0A853IE63_9GAMM|nr:outer membrane protein assembly factor BamE [Spartinivicinus marinus]MCX4027965.1 outer membrane protein assembly factor BamE [Spartinivicinus marinus]NYZ68241.1 outer membrane protein assembly factor BamE [Spartinivicinus marinus]
MQKTIMRLIILVSLTCLSACSLFSDSQHQSISFPGVHKIDIQQGNVVTQEMINQLRPGMTKRQVRYIMGTPLLVDTFQQDRWDYIYSYQPGGKSRVQETLSLYFSDGKLSHFTGDFRPEPPPAIEQPQISAEPTEEASATPIEEDVIKDIIE